MRRKRYTAEFKTEILQEAHELGSIAEVARKHDITPQLVYRWKKEAAPSSTTWTPRPKKQTVPMDASALGRLAKLEENYSTLADSIKQLEAALAIVQPASKASTTSASTGMKHDAVKVPPAKATAAKTATTPKSWEEKAKLGQRPLHSSNPYSKSAAAGLAASDRKQPEHGYGKAASIGVSTPDRKSHDHSYAKSATSGLGTSDRKATDHASKPRYLNGATESRSQRRF